MKKKEQDCMGCGTPTTRTAPIKGGAPGERVPQCERCAASKPPPTAPNYNGAAGA